MKINNFIVFFIYLACICSCSSKQYSYQYNLISRQSNDWSVSTNFYCLIGVESRLMSFTIGSKVRSAGEWQALCDEQFDGRPSISLIGSNLSRDASGVLFFKDRKVFLFGHPGRLNSLGQCDKFKFGEKNYDCMIYTASEHVSFSSLAPDFYIQISDGKKTNKFLFKLNKFEDIVY